MAAVNAIRTYLKDVIGLGNNAAGTAKADAIIDEGLDSVDVLAEMYEDDGDIISTLCRNVRKPAESIDDPSWVAPVGADGVPIPGRVAPQVPKPGQPISAICEQRLILAAYTATIYDLTGRVVTTAILTRTHLNLMKKHKATVDNHSEPDSLPEISKSFTVMKFLDQLPTYLKDILGVNGVALSYVIREDADPPNPLPTLRPNKPWSDDHDSVMDDLINFVPHDGPSYEADNASVFRILSNALASTSAMASISKHQRKRDGRKAYLDLIMHHMGSSKWEKVVENAEKLLTTRIWNGKNARYPLRIHISKHREAFNDLTRAADQIDYNVPNDIHRVRYLLNSITTTDATIISAKTTIQADPTKRNNFEEAADFLLITAPETKHNNNNKLQRISATKLGKIRTGPNTGVEIRFYKRHEWMKLKPEERQEVMDSRKGGKKKRKGDDDHDNNEYTKRIKALESQLEERNMTISKLSTNTPLPPPPKSTNPLKPPTGFTQRTGDDK